MLKILAGAALCAATALTASAAGAQASRTDEPVQVLGSRTASPASSQLSREIAANLRTPYINGQRTQPAGIVKVAIAPSGDVSVLQPSEFAAFDRAAVEAVRRSPSLDRVAATGRPLQAWMYFAPTMADEDAILATLRHDAATTGRVASADTSTILIAGQ